MYTGPRLGMQSVFFADLVDYGAFKEGIPCARHVQLGKYFSVYLQRKIIEQRLKAKGMGERPDIQTSLNRL